jgi:integrase/recombinase XerD
MLRGGMDIHKLQELLGHANISTTQVYTQVDREHIREAYEKAHPRAH